MGRFDVLADPIRLAIARFLARRPGASAPEVAGAAGVHLNTARAHLAALTEAGVAERRTERSGRRGRPVVRYRMRGRWAPRGDELLPLASLLAFALRGVERDAGRLRDLARAWGRHSTREHGNRSVEPRLAAAVQPLGFRARVEDDRLELSGCPCTLVAPEDPALVCALADGVVDGALEGSGVRARRWSHDPKVRRCGASLVNA